MEARRRRLLIMLYDGIPFLMVCMLILVVYPSSIDHLTTGGVWAQIGVCAGCMYLWRILGGIYRQIWRYGNTQAYIRLIAADTLTGITYYGAQMLLPQSITLMRALSIICLNLLCALSVRMLYQRLYEYIKRPGRAGGLLRFAAKMLFGISLQERRGAGAKKVRKIRLAIVGAGRVGVTLAEELIASTTAKYKPIFFIDSDREKIGRQVCGLNVLSEKTITKELMEKLNVDEVVFALPHLEQDKKAQLFEYYKQFGCPIKIYDYPLMQSADNGRRMLREFDVEDLLFRTAREFTDEKTTAYYHGKVVLISGGGGSIGSELCRQIAQMKPKRLIVLDVYENCAYDIQQELKLAYGGKLDLQVEIASVCDRPQLESIFQRYRPQVVLHAAAHKHVPLMEHNCCEAVRNNVFGTKNIVDVAEKYGVEKFIMISTDKAVNPTNVMGATKRMCEMIVQSRVGGNTAFSATRFGNVLGSNGSVIPLFKRQIERGGPVTLTDKRIIRYFMTITEASQLVLQSGAMANSGELYVLDMGRPVKILDLAETMVRLSGYEPYKDIDIVEVGLRPGEKLYEELLIRGEDLDKTDNSLIFVERDAPLGKDVIDEKLEILRKALAANDDEAVRAALKRVVPTYRTKEELEQNAG